MVEISLHRLQPFGHKVSVCLGTGNVKSPVAVLAPDYIAQTVTMVKETRLKYLLMQSRAVKAAVHRTQNVGDQLVIVGSCVNALGIKALVKHQSLKYLFAVEHERAVLDRHASHTKIALNLILANCQLQVVQPSVANFPKIKLLQLNIKDSVTTRDDRFTNAHRLALKAGLGAYGLAVTADAVCLDRQATAFHVGIIFKIFYVT